MKLSGMVQLGQQNYFLVYNDTRTYITYTLYNKYSKADSYRYVMGEALQDIVLTNKMAFEKYADARYLRCHAKQMKVTGMVTTTNTSTLPDIERILDVLRFADTYQFTANNIIQNSSSSVGIDVYQNFSASDRNLVYDFEKKNGMFVGIHISYRDTTIDLTSSTFKLKLDAVEMVTVSKEESKQIAISSLKNVTYQTLCDALDMTWFEENGIRKKDYKAITTIEELETLVISPLAHAVKFLDGTGEKLLLSIDTETTGLNVFNLDNNNPDKSRCVAIPIAWEDNKAFVIFTDMEHFDSIPNEYAMKRLEPFITKIRYNKTPTGRVETTRKVQTFSVRKDDEISLADLQAFGVDSKENSSTVESNALIKDDLVEFKRSTINLVGHNSSFDSRVFLDFGVRPWFDDDTQQMAFVLSPKVVRGSKKLKILTRKLLHCETPELEDILGRGNEDKYRYLRDKLVAEIYGCADADFTRLIFKALRGIMSNEMYEQYRKQDMTIINILYEAEYNGLPTDQKALETMAEHSKANLEILKNFMYEYVGRAVAVKNIQNKLRAKHDAGILSEEEFTYEMSNIDISGEDNRFEFEIKASSIREVLYNILGYHIFGYTNGDANGNNRLPKTDKIVMEKLMKCKLDPDSPEARKGWKLKHDVLASGVDYAEYEKAKAANSKKLEDMVLVDAERFNSCKYPLAIVLSKYAVLNKEYTSYFKPILETNMEGKIFKTFSLSRIETRRIMNPAQTMKGSLKALVRAYSDDYYLLDFDMAQVEYRIMASLAGHEEIIKKMKDPEKDYHIETAALVWSIPPHKVTKKLRKQTKSIGFGVPYGLSEWSLTEKLFDVVTEDTLFETRKLLLKWEASNKPIMDFLEGERDKALQVWNIPRNLRDYFDAYKREIIYDIKGKIVSNNYVLDPDGNKIPTKVGRAANKYGFYRTFDLENLDNRKAAKIRRMAGNYPIQSYAAELFRKILIRFYEICEEYGIQDKIKWHMLIHDELLCSVHKSVHPFLIYKLVKKACMISIKGHTNYFVGINVGNTWGEVKDDAREAPVYFVKRMVDRYDAGEFKEQWIDDVWGFIKPYREQYLEDRIGEVLKSIQPDLDTGIVDGPSIIEKMSNYTVRAYLEDYKPNRAIAPAAKGASDEEREYQSNEVFLSKLETWLIDVYGEGRKLRGQDGSVYVVNKGTEIVEKPAKEIDYEELFNDNDLFGGEDSYWSFDSAANSEESFISDDYGQWDEEEDFTDKVQFDFSRKNVRTIADLIVENVSYKRLVLSNGQLIIKLDRSADMEACKKFLKNDVVNSGGMSILFKTPFGMTRWLHVDQNINLQALDEFVDGIGKR